MDLDEVALADADRDHVARLIERTSFDEDEAEAIVRFAAVDEDDRDPGNIRSFVSNGAPDNSHIDIQDGLTPDECDRIRANMGKASRPTTVIDAWPDKHPSVIFRHATGRCEHDGDRDPVTSPRIQPDECREMRVDLQTGDTVDDIQATYNRSANAVTKHVFGRCDHDFDHDRAGVELSGSLCRRMRRVYRSNQSVSFEDVASAFVIGTSTAHRHIVGKCGHRDGVEAPIESNAPSPIGEAECDRMRVAYGYRGDAVAVADEADRDPTAVRKHVFGRCRHGESPHGPDFDTVDATLCKAIRHEYRHRDDVAVGDLVDRLETTRGTFFYHLRGDCSHDHGVDPVDVSGAEV